MDNDSSLSLILTIILLLTTTTLVLLLLSMKHSSVFKSGPTVTDFGLEFKSFKHNNTAVNNNNIGNTVVNETQCSNTGPTVTDFGLEFKGL